MIWALSSAVVAMLLAQLLLMPLPRPVLHYLAVNNAGWLLNDSERPTSMPGKMLQVFTNELIQQTVIAHFHDRFSQTEWTDDAAYAGMLLDKLRPTMISQREIYHTVIGTPTTLSGLGWCDALNGVAGRLLAHDFDHVEIVGVTGAKLGGGHSFGRFWSKQQNDWLYFDVWTEAVLIFKLRPKQAPEYLFHSRPVGPSVVMPDDFNVLKTYHARAAQGFVHVRYQSSLLGYIGSRLWNLASHGSTIPREAIAPMKAIAKSGQTVASPARTAPRHYSKKINSFIGARLAQMEGDVSTAKGLYRVVSQSDPKSSYGLAAAKFLDRLSPPKAQQR